LGLALALALWQALALVLPGPHLPSPVVVAMLLWDLALHGPLLPDIARTLARAATAFGVAMAFGTALGIALGRVRWADRLFATWLVIGLNLPAIVVAIVLFIWLNLTEAALILAVIVNKLPLVIVTLREGVRSFAPEYEELALAYRMPPARRLRLIILPQLVPFLLAAARTGLSLIWKIVLVFEVLGSDSGVGFRIGIFFQFFDVAGILAYTAAFVAVVLGFEYGVLRPAERRLQGWRWDRG
jgi:NitT/TauT family transport system permease protein